MSWLEIESKLESGVRTVIVPTASTEQHGPTLPLSEDELRGEALGERVADEFGCFVAPTVRSAISGHHMDFPGTISLGRETFEAVITDYCESLDAHGFENVVLFMSHGGNTEALDAIADQTDDELDTLPSPALATASVRRATPRWRNTASTRSSPVSTPARCVSSL